MSNPRNHKGVNFEDLSVAMGTSDVIHTLSNRSYWRGHLTRRYIRLRRGDTWHWNCSVFSPNELVEGSLIDFCMPTSLVNRSGSARCCESVGWDRHRIRVNEPLRAGDCCQWAFCWLLSVVEILEWDLIWIDQARGRPEYEEPSIPEDGPFHDYWPFSSLIHRPNLELWCQVLCALIISPTTRKFM
jgi:hypothetical protein